MRFPQVAGVPRVDVEGMALLSTEDHPRGSTRSEWCVHGRAVVENRSTCLAIAISHGLSSRTVAPVLVSTIMPSEFAEVDKRERPRRRCMASNPTGGQEDISEQRRTMEKS